MKSKGRPNDLIQRIETDSFFAPIHESLSELLDPSTFTGRAAEQVEEFLSFEVLPVLEKSPHATEVTELRV